MKYLLLLSACLHYLNLTINVVIMLSSNSYIDKTPISKYKSYITIMFYCIHFRKLQSNQVVIKNKLVLLHIFMFDVFIKILAYFQKKIKYLN